MRNLLNPKGYYRFYKKARKYYSIGKLFFNNRYFIDGQNKSNEELNKRPKRTEIINYILSLFDRETNYLEIGVRNPDANFNRILAHKKYSVDPGIEFLRNPVDFKLNSNDFFYKVRSGEILSTKIKFDVIFIDGMHLAEQVDRDIQNSMDFIRDDGFIIVHDCNPPTEWHARYQYNYKLTPALKSWNGTTWKAFLKWRFNSNIQSCCIDSDWGVGILSKNRQMGKSIDRVNQFYEIHQFLENRKKMLNLISFTEFKTLVNLKNSSGNE